ncbi:MAG: AAA family ATPase, partial [Huintestinicola sp.]
ILEDGILTDSQGRQASFANTVLILTSNVGAREMTEKNRLGFEGEALSAAEENKRIRADVKRELKKQFRPELLGRIDEVIVFGRLGKTELESLAQKLLGELRERAAAMEISMEFAPEAIKLLACKEDRSQGARVLRHEITERVENLLSSKIIKGEIKPGDSVILTADGDDLRFAEIQPMNG